jgi:anti-sigma B factor antagonist
MTVRLINPATSIIGIHGEVNMYAEEALMDAYTQACGSATSTIIMDFAGLDYMNSGGIGLLVTLLIRMRRQHQRLLVFNLSEHYQHIFALSRLNEAIGVYDSEAAALAATLEA